MNRLRFLFFASAIALMSSSAAFSQVATGTPPFGSFGGGPFDTVNLANLNVHLAIPIMNKAGVGLPFTYQVTYDNSVWYPVGSSGNQAWSAVTGWGWNSISAGSTGYVEEFVNTTQCTGQDGQFFLVTYYNFGPYVDAAGTLHSAVVTTTTGQTNCYPAIQPVTGGTNLATDGSGFTLVVSNYTTAVIKSLGGVTINPYIWQVGGFTLPYGSVVDPNGNTISSTFSAPTTSFTDTLNTTALTVSAPAPPSNTTFSYTNPQGNTSTPFTMSYTQEIVETNFGCSGITDYGRTTQMNQYLVASITLPDGTSYQFSYEPTPNPVHSGAVTGRLASVTLPTGGKISYTYTGANNGIVCADGSTPGFKRYTPDTGSNYHWQYAHSETGTAWTTTVTDPLSDVTNYYFVQVSGTQLAYEAQRTVANSGGTTLLTVNTCYNGTSIPCNSTAIAYPLANRTVQTTLPNLSPSKTYTVYNSYSLPTEFDEYDYGGTTPLRKTFTQYYVDTTNPYIVNRLSSIAVCSPSGTASACNGAGTVLAQATYGYDANGNLLSEAHTNTTGSPTSISRTFTHNTNGTLATATDFDSSSNITSYTYGSGSCNGAFPTTISLPMSISISSITWNCNGGVITSFKDANSQPTTFTYNDPNHFWRVTGVSYPDGGNTTITYTDTLPNFTVAYSQEVTASANHQTTQVLDGLGRITQYQDNSASTYVDTLYDSLGRVYTVSNPYATKSDPTYGLTIYGYDALNRPTSVEAPDGSTTLTTYSTKCGSTTDPASKMRKLCSDALGRITSVTEDPNGLNYQTTYTYDDLDDLHVVTQGSQTRTYNYDMLARLTSAQTPEVNVTGTQCSTSYGYDANGNLTSKVAPLENQTTSCANTVTTTYAYDALNRLTSRSYNDTPRTPPANFFYDQAPSSWPAWPGVSFSYPIGRLVLACTNSPAGTCTSPQTATALSYDTMGRTKDFWQCNPSNCGTSSIWSTQYTYDLAGDVTSWVHPGGFTLTNTVSPAQQITAVQSSWQDSNHPQNLAQSVSYTAWGAVSQLVNGCAGSGCTNTQETYQYNKQLQPAVIELGASGGNAAADYCLVYNYYGSSPTSCALPSAGTSDNGNVMGYWYQDNVNPSSFSHTATYTYDGVNRLATAVATGNATYNLKFGYDAYGNMTCQINGQTNGPCPNWAYNPSTNQLTTSGFTYDAAGDLAKDSSNLTPHTYQWDAEGRVAAVDPGSSPTWNFTYNAPGDRVQWAYGSSGAADQHLFDPAGTWLGNYGSYTLVPLGGRYFVVYTSSETNFDHINNLGSTTMWTNHSGAEAEDILFYPWGDLWQGSGGYNFASLPYRDLTTTTDITTARFSSPNLGRWLSPDPLGGDVTNPQTLNRYAYVLNNPTSLTDPLGLQGCDPGDPDCCDPFDPTCTPTPSPCNPEEDPWACQGPFWPPPPPPPGGGGTGSGGGSTGSSAGNPPSNNFTLGTKCLSDAIKAAIENELLNLFKSAFGTTLNRGDPGVTFRVNNGTVTLTVDQPSGTPVTKIPTSTGTPILHPYDYEIRPEASVPEAPGDFGHVMWNLDVRPNTVYDAQEHMDIGTFSITHPGGTVRHGIRAAYEFFAPAPDNCAQKFADFGMF